MADISKVRMLNGTEYNYKDAKARSDIEGLKADLDAQDKYTILLNDEVPNTIQAYTFNNGKVSQVVHSRNSAAVRTDAFTYGTGTITEVRTLNTGESLTIVTNLTTLETIVTYNGGV